MFETRVYIPLYDILMIMTAASCIVAVSHIGMDGQVQDFIEGEGFLVKC